MKRLRNILIGIDLFLLFIIAGTMAERNILSFSVKQTDMGIPAMGQMTSDSGDSGNDINTTAEQDPAKDIKRVALTFDDDVIIGLSQEDC